MFNQGGGCVRYAIYARVSTALDEQKNSYDSQVKDLRSRVQTLKPDFEFVHVYGDRGISGTTDDRPQFQQMLSDARNGHFDCIVTKSISRFARNTRILLNNIKELEECGVHVWFLEENINTSQASQQLLLTILGAVSQMEADNTKSHIKESFALKRSNGLMARPQAVSFGYKLVEHKVVIADEAAKIVTEIFDWFVNEGLSAGSIVTRLMEKGYTTSRGLTRWNRHTVLYILKNPKYSGRAKETDPATGEEFFFDYPKIVNQGVFDRAQELLKVRSRTYEKFKSYNRNFAQGLYALSQITKCEKCGDVCTRYTTHPETPRHTCNLEDDCQGHPMWGCINHSGNRNSDKYCSGYNISEQYVYWAIIDALIFMMQRPDFSKHVYKRLEEEKMQDVQFEKQIALYNARISELEQQRKTELTLFRKGLISESEVTSNVKKIDKEKSKLKKPTPKSYSGLTAELIDVIKSYSEYKWYEKANHTEAVEKKLFEMFSDPELKRKIVRGLVEEVRIGGENKYQVTVKFFGFDTEVKFRFPRRAPTKRHGHLLSDRPFLLNKVL